MTDVDELLRQVGPPPALPVDEAALRLAVSTGRTRRRRRGAASGGVFALAVVGAFAAAHPLLAAVPDRLVVADSGPSGDAGPAPQGPEYPAPAPAPGGTVPSSELPRGPGTPPAPAVPVVASDPDAGRLLLAYTSVDGRSCLVLLDPLSSAHQCPRIDPQGVTVFAAGPVLSGTQLTERLTPPVTYGTVPQTATSVLMTGPGGRAEFPVVEGGSAPVNYYLTRYAIEGTTVVAAYDADGDLVAHSVF